MSDDNDSPMTGDDYEASIAATPLDDLPWIQLGMIDWQAWCVLCSALAVMKSEAFDLKYPIAEPGAIKEFLTRPGHRAALDRALRVAERA